MNKKLLFLGLALLSGATEISAAAFVARAARNGASQGRIISRRIHYKGSKEQINSIGEANPKNLKGEEDSDDIANLINKNMSKLSPEKRERLRKQILDTENMIAEENRKSDRMIQENRMRLEALNKRLLEEELLKKNQALNARIQRELELREAEFIDNIKFSIAAIAWFAGLYGYSEWELKKLEK